MDENNDESSDLIYETDDKGQRVLVRSIESTQRAYLRFTNRTLRPVNVWWRDFRGNKRLYVRLEAGSYYNINSFITHPWEFTDANTKEHYVINNNPIYRPPPNIGGMMYRTNWNITVTVRTLRASAMLAVADQFGDPRDVNELGLPKVLAEDVQRLVIKLKREPDPPPRE